MAGGGEAPPPPLSSQLFYFGRSLFVILPVISSPRTASPQAPTLHPPSWRSRFFGFFFSSTVGSSPVRGQSSLLVASERFWTPSLALVSD